MILDEQAAASEEQLPLAKPPDGWLRAVRKSLGVSQRAAAEKAGVSQQAFDQYEKGELRATISLESLQRAAAAIDCDVVYYLKPRTAVALSFEGLSVRRQARKQPKRSRQTPPKPAPRDEHPEDRDLPLNLL